MNRMNVQKNMMKLFKPDKLADLLRDTLLDLDDKGLTGDMVNKVLACHFTILLAAQNKSISFLKYTEMIGLLVDECLQYYGEIPEG